MTTQKDWPCSNSVLVLWPHNWLYTLAIEAVVKGVTTAAIGAITGAVVVLGRRTITDIPTVVLALVTLILLWRWKKIPEPLIVLGVALIGLVAYSLLQH